MKFEVINSDGQVVMQTTSNECVPTLDELESMSSAGYRYKVDGKIIGKTRVMEAVGRSKLTASSINTASKKSGKQVRCIETGDIYSSKVEAGKAFGISDSSVYDSIRLNKKVKGYSFELV